MHISLLAAALLERVQRNVRYFLQRCAVWAQAAALTGSYVPQLDHVELLGPGRLLTHLHRGKR
jgi:hypothetical protein